MLNEHYSLVVAYDEGLEDGQLDLRLFEPITGATEVTNLLTGDKLLVVAVGDDEEYLREEELSWFRLISSDAHLARYVRNGEIYDCEWDEQGEAIDDSDTTVKEV